MSDIRETVIDHVAGEDFASISTSERKWISQIHKLKEEYPDDVEIRHVNEDGSLIARFPAYWMRVRPKRKVNLTQEQIEEMKERLELGRKKIAQNRSADQGAGS